MDQMLLKKAGYTLRESLSDIESISFSCIQPSFVWPNARVRDLHDSLVVVA
ncbi:hypothetical protein ACPPVV_01040 [Rhodanobacter sp. Col0626]|uniref:hypothetical protein n=1 Tax=Rhodanobacter sp. Col0626 TaxID=3415679 RepID=UPI003CEAFC6C